MICFTVYLQYYMRKSIVILLLAVYSIGTLFLPMGDFAYIHYLPEMYQQCAGEDPDMDAVDFVFEHLLNLPEIDASKESPDDREKPHQPFHQSHSVSQIVVTVSKPLIFEFKPTITSHEKITYLLMNDCDLSTSYLSEVFHPPIV